VTYTYDNLGETASKTDQNGTTHSYSYDPLGRLTLDWVTSLGAGVDGSIMALGYSYNRQGLPFQQTSYYTNPAYDSGATVNQDQDQYNGFGQLTAEYQSDSGPVDTSPGGTPEVQYGYSSALLGSRLTSMTYPNGRVIYYGYDGNALDNALGRVDYLADSDGTHLADYSYLGLSTIVGQTDGDGVTETTSLDQFGRIAEMNYVNTATHASTDDFSYGYDANGNVLYKSNGVNPNFSELYTYDSLNRLTTFNRGTLAAGNNAIATANSLPGSSQSWALDAIGNQTATTTDGATTTKSQNSQNELTGMGGATLSYDNNGNMTTAPDGNTYVYDAWNRLTYVQNSSGIILDSYSYDANGRRITETHGSTTTNVYFDAAGQVVEECQKGGTAATAQYVWNLDYVNDLLEQDTAANGRLYAQHDANFNVTALVSNNGTVAQRFVYSPYGVQTVLNGAWAETGTALTVYGDQGGRADFATGLVHFGLRDDLPSAAIWIQQDPAGYVDGANRYQLETSNPGSFVDPAGTEAWYQGWGTTIGYMCGGGPASGTAAQVWGAAVGGAEGGLSIATNTVSHGLSDAVGLTNSNQYQGSDYDGSRTWAAFASWAFDAASTGAISGAAGKLAAEWGFGALGQATAGGLANALENSQWQIISNLNGVGGDSWSSGLGWTAPTTFAAGFFGTLFQANAEANALSKLLGMKPGEQNLMLQFIKSNPGFVRNSKSVIALLNFLRDAGLQAAGDLANYIHAMNFEAAQVSKRGKLD